MEHRNDDEQGQHIYVRALMQSWEQSREMLAIATERFDDPNRCLRRRGDPHRRVHARLHASIIDYRDEVAPYRDRVDDLWEASFDTTMRMGAGTATLTLATLGEARVVYGAVERETGRDGRMTQRQLEEIRSFIPLALAEEAYNQLNDCVSELDFLPGRTEHRAVIDEEMLDDVYDWQREHLEGVN